MRHMKKNGGVGLAALALALIAYGPAPARAGKPVVAVFDFKARRVKVHKETLVSLTDYLAVQLTGTGASIYNGQAGSNGSVYLVRNDYFEPVLGHTAEQAITALEAKTRLGRPTLLETHRFNFLGSDERQTHALAELEKLLQRALDIHPDLAFLSTEKVARILKNNDPAWVEQGLGRKLHVWLARLGEIPRLRKLAWLSGWIVPGWRVWKLTA